MENNIGSDNNSSHGSLDFNFEALDGYQGEGSSSNGGAETSNNGSRNTPEERLNAPLGGSNDGAGQQQNAGQGVPAETQELEIDPRFASLSPVEARIRTLQSRLDSTSSNYEKLVAQYEETKRYQELLDELVEDENLLSSFVEELKPGLIKRKDVSALLKESLDKEFGEGYAPELSRDEAERKAVGGKDWLYYKRADELYLELKKGGATEKMGSVKEYLQKKAQTQANEQRAFEAEILQAKTKYKMDDAEVQNTLQFGQQLNFDRLVKLVRFLSRFPELKMGGITRVPGSPSTSLTERQRFLKEITQTR